MLLALSEGRVIFLRIVWFFLLVGSVFLTIAAFVHRFDGMRRETDPVKLHYATRLIYGAVGLLVFMLVVGWWFVDLEMPAS